MTSVNVTLVNVNLMAYKKRKKKVPKGYHRMPNGKLMKGSKHPKRKKKRKK